MLNPIPTYYKGYRFRSRLEARWAVFFENMGYDWVYEPEGYILEDGACYLPDFLLDNEYFIEVKPKKLTDKEIIKAKLLSKGSGKIVIFCVGTPNFRNYYYVQWCIDDGDFNINNKKYDNSLIFRHKEQKYFPFYYASGMEDDSDSLIDFVGIEYHKAIIAVGNEKFSEKKEDKNGE